MGVLANSREFFRVLGEFGQLLPSLAYRMPAPDSRVSLGALFEDTVARYPNNTMLLFEDKSWTYAEFNREVNRLAHLLSAGGIERGRCVALVMENRPEFLLSMLALMKVGAQAALVNSSLGGEALAHCFRATGASACIVGEECSLAVAAVVDQLPLKAGRDYFYFADSGATALPDWALDAGVLMEAMPADNLPITGDITAGETAFYIFTSGTTGLPKAAIMLHRKILTAAYGFGGAGFRVKPDDRLYLCLPIYHITGMGAGFCAFISAGGSVFLRRRFSASSFWAEVQHYRTNCFVYVGELCRYLASQAERPEERNNPLEKMLGNGLRPDVWDTFKARFGVSRICEIYGSSEGNISFVNVLNKNRTIGAALTPVALVAYDIDNDEILRDSNGRCREVGLGEAGLLLGEISAKAQFDGYTNPEATQSKIVQSVKIDGDRWFNTGDLVRQIDVGFAMGLKHFQFVDRTGDTFRWRAENVSTNEVAEVLNQHPQISMANVYGVEVPGVEGRAGMVAVAMDDTETFDLAGFQSLVEQQLPVYAQPVFIRLLSAAETTVTFKLLKTELREQAYHLDTIGQDVIYIRKPHSRAYERLDGSFYQALLEAKAGY